ncbi:RnfH family protein [Hydrogenophaga sp.]|uniref:RnfH family protein n=1 Tax=Hydrogenophaga sp. TaxID=1904254 RepID=UPI001996C8C5|nr:RnfH family protein [Hydrogenophaga sp.]MBD3892564.1 RnfH family protein [Hydrogenophaga sp.]
MQVTLIYSSAPRTVHEAVLELDEGATVEQALRQAGWLQRFPEIGSTDLTLGVWGRRAGPQTPLRADDRVEVYRALRVDPKVARKERFVAQGARAAGLFSRKKPGSEAGY